MTGSEESKKKSLERAAKKLKSRIEDMIDDPSLSEEHKTTTAIQWIYEQVLKVEKGAKPNHFVLYSILYDSDRGSFLTAASAMDNELEEILSKHFKEKSAISSDELYNLFHGMNSPFQNTSVKIKLAFTLGFIDEALKKTLQQIQKIRSEEAAHTKEPFEIKKMHCQQIMDRLPKTERDLVKSRVATENMPKLKEWIGNLAPAKTLSNEKLTFLFIMNAVFKLLAQDHK